MERQLLVSRVKALAEALEDSSVGELDLTEGGVRVVIRRRLAAEVIEVAAPVAPVAPAAPVVNARPRRARSARASGGESPAKAPETGVAVVAPLTGVFYLAASPSEPPFIKVGDSIQVGQVVCLVEAMKVFNEIKAEVSGTVIAIPPQNGQLVQKGDALIRVNPV